MYIHEYKNWTDFRWDSNELLLLLENIYREQGRLLGRLTDVGYDNQLKSMVENMTTDIVYSSEIEGIKLNIDEVRSSIARHLGLDIKDSISSSHYVDGVVAVTLEAIQNYGKDLTAQKLCQWQAAFFPTGRSSGIPIETGVYRTNEEHIVSGSFGRERIHYIAPSPERVPEEMDKFLGWFNASDSQLPSVIRSAIAHFWFVSIHPFEDGNGRLGRILGDMMIAKGDKNKMRFYNLSSVINKDKRHYYEILERTQRGNGDITSWLKWYLGITLKAIQEANQLISTVLNKTIFWRKTGEKVLNERQINTLNLFLDGYEAKITSKTWANINKCSKDTAIRDIDYLVKERILIMDIPNAKRPSYSINYGIQKVDILEKFSDIEVIKENDNYYLSAVYNNLMPIKERILGLDAERALAKELPVENLLQKYCSHIMISPNPHDVELKPDISDVRIFKGVSETGLRIRCRINGIQQMAKELEPLDMEKWYKLMENGDTRLKNDLKLELCKKYYKTEIELANDHFISCGIGR